MDIGILDRKVHARLIADLQGVAEVAGVPPYMITKSAKDYVSEEELEWIMNFRSYRARGHGLVITGVQSIAPDTKLMAIAGALLRNFIDARVVPIGTLVEALEDGEVIDPTVLLVPNLFVRSVGKALPDWKVQQLYDLLLSRVVGGRPTVVCVEDLDALSQIYGRLFHQHLLHHYKVV